MTCHYDIILIYKNDFVKISDLLGVLGGRQIKVYLTAEGQDIIRSLDPVVAAFNERLLQGDQRQAFFEQLQQLIATVSTIAPSTGDRFSFLSEYLRQAELLQQRLIAPVPLLPSPPQPPQG